MMMMCGAGGSVQDGPEANPEDCAVSATDCIELLGFVVCFGLMIFISVLSLLPPSLTLSPSSITNQ